MPIQRLLVNPIVSAAILPGLRLFKVRRPISHPEKDEHAPSAGMSNGFTTCLDNLARMLQIPSALPPFQTASIASDRVGDSSVKWRVGTWILDFANNSHPNVT